MPSSNPPLYQTVLQVSPERIATLTDAELTTLMDALIRAQAYRCRADLAQVCVKTEGRASDAGCDGWSPRPPTADPWLGDVETCWQFKAATAGQPARVRGEVTKQIPRNTLRTGCRFVLGASGSVSGRRGEDDRLSVLRQDAVDAGLPSDKIHVLGSETLTTWCNQHPSIAARWAGRPSPLVAFADWEHAKEHRVPWHPSDDQRQASNALFTPGDIVPRHGGNQLLEFGRKPRPARP